MKRLIIDIDDTICSTSNGDYINSTPNRAIIKKINEYKALGFEIVFFSSRNMRTYKNEIGKINIHTVPVIIDWLDKNGVEYDELHVGKPWCGFEGFYVDDKAIRPSEFLKYTYEEIISLLSMEKIK